MFSTSAILDRLLPFPLKAEWQRSGPSPIFDPQRQIWSQHEACRLWSRLQQSTCKRPDLDLRFTQRARRCVKKPRFGLPLDFRKEMGRRFLIGGPFKHPFLLAKSGGHCHKLVEPMVTVKENAAQWFRPEIDLDELAKLRWSEKWTQEQLAAHFRRPRATIIRRLKELEGGDYGGW